MSAVDAFRGAYRLEALRRETDAEWDKVDALMLPTSPDIQTVEAMRADPLALNARFGRFTNFANFFGCAAIAVPAGFTQAGLPFGVQLVAPRDTDEALAAFASTLHEDVGTGSGLDRSFVPPSITAPSPKDDEDKTAIEIAVVGAHLSGMPLNHELTTRGAVLLEETRTAPHYRLFALATTPPKPGLLADPAATGDGIAVEVWSMSVAAFGSFVAAIPAPLGIGKITLADGRSISGFLCEYEATRDAVDISRFGGWRAYRKGQTVAA